MPTLTHIFKPVGGMPEIIIQIDDVRITLPESHRGYTKGFINPKGNAGGYGSFTQIEIAIPSLKHFETLHVGQHIHENKLEVLKSEYKWTSLES